MRRVLSGLATILLVVGCDDLFGPDTPPEIQNLFAAYSIPHQHVVFSAWAADPKGDTVALAVRLERSPSPPVTFTTTDSLPFLFDSVRVNQTHIQQSVAVIATATADGRTTEDTVLVSIAANNPPSISVVVVGSSPFAFDQTLVELTVTDDFGLARILAEWGDERRDTVPISGTSGTIRLPHVYTREGSFTARFWAVDIAADTSTAVGAAFNQQYRIMEVDLTTRLFFEQTANDDVRVRITSLQTGRDTTLVPSGGRILATVHGGPFEVRIDDTVNRELHRLLEANSTCIRSTGAHDEPISYGTRDSLVGTVETVSAAFDMLAFFEHWEYNFTPWIMVLPRPWTGIGLCGNPTVGQDSIFIAYYRGNPSGNPDYPPAEPFTPSEEAAFDAFVSELQALIGEHQSLIGFDPYPHLHVVKFDTTTAWDQIGYARADGKLYAKQHRHLIYGSTTTFLGGAITRIDPGLWWFMELGSAGLRNADPVDYWRYLIFFGGAFNDMVLGSCSAKNPEPLPGCDYANPDGVYTSMFAVEEEGYVVAWAFGIPAVMDPVQPFNLSIR